MGWSVDLRHTSHFTSRVRSCVISNVTSELRGVGCNVSRHGRLWTDGRFSGGSHGLILGHTTPEAQLGGPIPGRKRRHGHDGRREPALRRRPERCTVGRTPCPLDTAAAESPPRHALQVHPNREVRLQRLRYRPVVTRVMRSPCPVHSKCSNDPEQKRRIQETRPDLAPPQNGGAAHSIRFFYSFETNLQGVRNRWSA